MTELPCTPEEILIWRLAQPATSVDSYHFRLYNDNTTEMSGIEIRLLILDWLKSIVHLEGIVTYEKMLRAYTPACYRVLVAGIWIFVISKAEYYILFGVTHD
jgi:hypothetical protein